MFSVKTFTSGEEVLLAACDEELLGKEFKDGKKRLLVTEEFYGGRLVEEEELVSLLEMATIANLTGERVVGVAVKAGVVDPQCVLEIGGVPHAQMVRRL